MFSNRRLRLVGITRMLDAPITTHPTSNTPASQKCRVCSAGAFSGPCTDKLVASVAASFFSALNPDIQAIVVFSIEVGAQFSTALHGAFLSNRCQKHYSSLLAARWTPYYPTFASCVAWRKGTVGSPAFTSKTSPSKFYTGKIGSPAPRAHRQAGRKF